MKQTIELNTVQDLVNFVTSSTWAADERFKLSESSSEVYLDEFAGAQWEEGLLTVQAANPKYYKYTYSAMQPDEILAIEKDKAAVAAWRETNPQPAKRRVEKGYLQRSGGSWRSDTYWLSEELYAQVYAVWTKKPRWAGSSFVEPYGSMTLKGLLKRLGRSEIGTLVEDAVALRKLQDEANARNNNRKYVRSETDKFLALLKERSNRPGFPFSFGEGSLLFSQLEQLMVCCEMQDEVPTALPADRPQPVVRKPQKKFSVALDFEGERQYLTDTGWTTDRNEAGRWSRAKAEREAVEYSTSKRTLFVVQLDE